MDSVSGDGFRSEYAMFLKAVDHAHTVFVQAVVFIRFVFGSMNVEAYLVRRRLAALT
jgi:hypothetical protein